MLKLTIYNISVKIETTNHVLVSHINNFLEKFYTVRSRGFNRASSYDEKIFASKIQNYNIYYLHHNQYYHLREYLHRINYIYSIDEKEDKKNYTVEVCPMTVRPNWQPYDYQQEIINFLLNKPERSKLVPLQTGKGKGLISLVTIAKLSQRTGIVILPTYTEKWLKEICEVHDTTPDKVMVVQGQKSLKALIELAKSNELESPYIIFSSRTLQEFINAYEENSNEVYEIYGIEPIELFSLLGIGVLIIDETHQHFHAIFKILLHINVKFHIGLSATLLSDNHIVRKIHNVVYPKDYVYVDNNYDRYIDVYPISYNTAPNNLKFIRTTNFGSNNYSHIAFEKSLIKRAYLLENYFGIISNTIDNYFLEDHLLGDKLMIFVSTVEMATLLTEYIRKSYTTFVTNRYCEDDSFDNLHNCDIVVTTVISAGTGIDIKNLRVVIQTISISSIVANIQTLGRLRKLSDRDTKFCYLYCNNIDKHRIYHARRKEIFVSRAKSIVDRSCKLVL